MKFRTADLCDDHDAILQVAEGVFGDFGGLNCFCGTIATVKSYEDNSLVRSALDESGEGRVLVIDGGASMKRSMLGDQLAEKAVSNGWRGVVINGCLRDSAAIAEMALGVKALGTVPRKTVKQDQGLREVTVHFADVDFIPGHWLYADEDGMVVCAEKLVDIA